MMQRTCITRSTRVWLIIAMLFILSPIQPSQAHVGSPGVLYEGMAGPYRILVNINPPDVIPGTAMVSVFVEGAGITKVTARPIHYRSGDEGAPSPDVLEAVPDEPGHFQGMVWLMWRGSFSVQINVEGAAGKGEANVPVVAVVTAQREMPAHLGWILAGLATLLFVLMVTIIGASVSDGTLKPGEALTPAYKQKRIVTMGISALVCGLILFGGSAWWNSWAENYRQYMYKPITARADVQLLNGERVLTLQMDTTGWKNTNYQTSYLIPDHGKLMHLFLVRQPGFDAFAHLHPDRLDSITFSSTLPPLPAGQYKVFADIVHRNGYTETITATLDNPATAFTSISVADSLPGDPEDTYVVTNPLNSAKLQLADYNAVVCGSPGVKTKLADGSTIIWEQADNASLSTGKITTLTFSVADPEGQPAKLEPYLGMAGHAVVMRDDGSVFIHLHPVGTYSMAARQSLENRIADTVQTLPTIAAQAFRDSVDRVVAQLKGMSEAERMALLMPEMNHSVSLYPAHPEHDGAMVTFPYVFPQPGNYRIWVQVKRNGKVLTGAFDARVN